MDNICLICKKSFNNLRGLHAHISKGEKLSPEKYYHLHFPRTDILTNELIKFKDYEQYFSSFFNSKENLNHWFKENYKTSQAAEVAKDILKNRIDRKSLKFAPTQLELRTANSPTIIGCEKMFDYNEYMKSLGLTHRFDYKIKTFKPTEDIKVLIDTREQLPFKFENSKVRKLDVGDYTADGSHYADIFIERKSIQDFFGTFYQEQSLTRFYKEVERARDMGLYLIVVVESTLNSCLEYKPYPLKDNKFALATFSNVREILEKYFNIQFVFSYSRATAQNLVLNIFSQGENARNIDWQFATDSKLL